MGGIHHWTIFGHFIFFLLLSGFEYAKPSEAPKKLIEPLTKAPRSVEEYAKDGKDNLSFKFVFLGLRKYHLLFSLACLMIFINTINDTNDTTTDATLLLEKFACLFLGLNFLLDDMYAAAYIQFAQTYAILIPQALFAAYDIALFFVDNNGKPDNDDYADAIGWPIGIVVVGLGASLLRGLTRIPMQHEYENTELME